MYIIICETESQSRFNAWDRVLRAGALGWPRGMEWGGRWEGGSGWGTHVRPWQIHVNIWQKPLKYCKVISLQLNKLILKKKILKKINKKEDLEVSRKKCQLEKAMAPHSSTLAWKIPWMEEPGRLQSMESLRAGHDWATSLSLFTFMHWRKKWLPTPVFLPGESQGQRSLVGCRLWGRTESDTTEAT